MADGGRRRRGDRAHVPPARPAAPRSKLAASDGRGGSARRVDRRGSGSDLSPLEIGPDVFDRAGLVLVLSSLWATAELIDDLIHGGHETNSASALLEAGSIVWVSNIIAFALLYWNLDGGGAAARALDPSRRIDFAFPQEINRELASPGWRPRFVDYLYLGFTNATALSPTDAMPLAPWAKLAMMLQSVISLGILALVIARAVNVFS
jgi:hypothetical protein